MGRVRAAGSDAPGTQPAPLALTAAAAHVVAALGLVRGDFAARAGLGGVLDEAQSGRLGRHVVAYPLGA